jgi:uncharacterized protein YdaU (DUF1376 family)
MTKKRWFRFYIDAWLNGTFGLTPNEIAAYVTVLCELYDNDGLIIRPDLDVMARRCGMRPSSFRKALDTLSRRGKLALEGDTITSKAVSEEIKSREKLDRKSAESRTKGAEKANENRPIRQKMAPNKEYRIEINKTLDVEEASPSQKKALSPAVENFVKRRELFRRRAG